jgi:hypothetical protein
VVWYWKAIVVILLGIDNLVIFDLFALSKEGPYGVHVGSRYVAAKDRRMRIAG